LEERDQQDINALKNEVAQRMEPHQDEVIEIDDKEEEKKEIEVKEEKPKIEEKIEASEVKAEVKDLPQLIEEKHIENVVIPIPPPVVIDILPKKAEPIITPNDIVEEITELTNPQADGNKRKKNPSKKSTKKRDEIKVDKVTEETSTKIKLRRDEPEEKGEEGEENNVTMVEDMKIRIEKGNDVMKVKMVNDESQEQM